MKTPLTIFVVFMIVAILVMYAFCYQVRYDEVVVHARWGAADEGDVVRENRLHFRLPLPIDDVRRYPIRIQILEHPLIEVPTSDKYQVNVATYLAWRIEKPLKFYQKLETINRAEERLRDRLGAVNAIVSEYRFDQLVNLDESKLKLQQLEEQAERELGPDLLNDFGIKVVQFGVRRILLPESTTNKVFDSMKQSRDRLAERARSEGKAEAKNIRSLAELKSRRILDYAESYAQGRRSEAELVVAKDVGVFSQDQDFAIFLEKLRAMKIFLGKFVTAYLSSEELMTPHSTLKLRDKP